MSKFSVISVPSAANRDPRGFQGRIPGINSTEVVKIDKGTARYCILMLKYMDKKVII